MMMRGRIARRAGLLALLVAVASGAVLAQNGPGEVLPVPADTLPAHEFNALMTFVAANPGCQSFSDGCQICRRLTGRQLACSTPGIACQKGEWRCQTSAPASSEPSPAR